MSIKNEASGGENTRKSYAKSATVSASKNGYEWYPNPCPHKLLTYTVSGSM